MLELFLELVHWLKQANIPTILLVGSLLFIGLAIIGNVARLGISLDSLQRKHCCIVGIVFFVLSFLIAIVPNSNPVVNPPILSPVPHQKVELAIDGSSSMIDITLNDKKKFEEKFPGSKITEIGRAHV
mgnify:CR=1 FL=1